MLSRDEILALFERRRTAWLRGDLDAYLACFDDELEFRSPGRAEPLRGKSAYAALVRRSDEAVRPLSFDLLHLAIDRETVLAAWEIAVERRGDGRRLQWHGMSAFTFRGDRIRTWRELWDPVPG